jgi:hypothetical protein
MGMIVALVLSTDGQESFYSATPAWAVFATIAAIVQFAPSLAKQHRLVAGAELDHRRRRRRWVVRVVGADRTARRVEQPGFRSRRWQSRRRSRVLARAGRRL